MDRELACIIGLILAALVMLVVATLILLSASCHARFANSGLQSDWGIMSGCRVNVPGQGWIPADNYRVL